MAVSFLLCPFRILWILFFVVVVLIWAFKNAILEHVLLIVMWLLKVFFTN